MSESAPPSPPVHESGHLVTPQRPWLGLASFTADCAEYFFGRDREVSEIHRRLHNHSLTILYGQSGLGKTSLLGAGLLPSLRAADVHAPVLIRLRYVEGAPSLLDQTRAALRQAARQRGPDRPDPDSDADPVEAKPPQTELAGAGPVEAEPETGGDELSLWEHFHRVDLALDPGQLVPVLIFDQFEEIFTLGRANPERKAEVEAWLTEMADLIQNRPPAELVERMRDNRRLAASYDFTAPAPRIVFSLREDYLSHLEEWKARLPLLMQNRMALHPLDGTGALQAITGPASFSNPPLVGPEVAARMVRTVARVPDDTPLKGISAVPPILSLLAEQLNSARLERNLPQITAELVRSESADILQSFYEDSLHPFPPKQREAIRGLIEDQMVTVSGHRSPVARDNARDELKRAGVDDPDQIIQHLIDRRLITAEERGTSFLEITHDVLLPVITASRDQRQLRKARQRLRRRALTVLLIVVPILSTIGLVVSLRARNEAAQARALAEREAQRADQAAANANASRKTAEDLIDDILFDLHDSLEPLGRLDLLDDVSASAQNYFDNLPEDQARDPEIRRNHSVMLMNRGDVLFAQGDTERALEAFLASRQIATELVETDPTQKQWQQGLSQANGKVGDVLRNRGDAPAALEAYRASLEIAQRFAGIDPDNADWQHELALARSEVGDLLFIQGDSSAAFESYQDALAIRQKLAETDPDNTNWQKELSDSYEQVGQVLLAQGKTSEALEAHNKSLGIVLNLAETDPGNTTWQHDLCLSHGEIGNVLLAEGEEDSALDAYNAALAIAMRLVRTDPTNTQWSHDLCLAHLQIGDVHLARGDAAALRFYRSAIAIARRLTRTDPTNTQWKHTLSVSQNKLGDALLAKGDTTSALEAYNASREIAQRLAETDPSNAQWQRDLAMAHEEVGDTLLARDDLSAALEAYQSAKGIIEDLVKSNPGFTTWQRDLANSQRKLGDALLDQGEARQALQSYQRAEAIGADLVELDPNMRSWQAELQLCRQQIESARAALSASNTENNSPAPPDDPGPDNADSNSDAETQPD